MELYSVKSGEESSFMANTFTELDQVGVKVDYRSGTTRFSCRAEESLTAGLRHLDEHGYAVISDVMDDDEINTAKNLIWQHLEGLKSPYKIKRGQVNSWNQWPGRHEAGIIEENGIGNSQVQWFVRSIPMIKDIFARIWQTRDLLTSMDGIGLFRPWHLNPRQKNFSFSKATDEDSLTLRTSG